MTKEPDIQAPAADRAASSLDPAAGIVDLYRRHGAAWAAARAAGQQFMEQPWLDRFAGLAGQEASILDLGCGLGQPIAAYLAGLGHPITGVDSSPVLLDRFRACLPDAGAVAADMRGLALGRTFGGVLAWDSFFHLTHDDQRAMFPVFRDHAAPGAPLMFTSGPAHGEAIGSLEGEPLYHASLAPEAYRALLDGHGFDLVDHVAEDPTCGHHTIWLARRR